MQTKLLITSLVNKSLCDKSSRSLSGGIEAKKELIKLIFIFFISIFVIGMIPIVQLLWTFLPTKLVTKEEKQHIEYVVNTAFEDNLGVKVKKIEIPTLVSRVTYQYEVKV